MAKLDATALVVMAVIGIVAGWIAKLILGGSGSLVSYLVTGVLGSFVGGFVLNALGLNLGIKSPIASQIVTATIGALIVIILARLVL